MKTIHLIYLASFFLMLQSCGNDPEVFSVSDADSKRNSRIDETPTGVPGEDPAADSGTNTDGENPDSSSDPDSDGDPAGEAVLTPEEIRALCGNVTRVETFVQRVRFEQPTTTCAWSAEGNLSEVQGVVRARREQYTALPIEGESVICGVGFTVPQQQVQFDDEIFLLFNNVVLATSKDYTYALPQRNGMFFYDWMSLRDEPYLPDGESHNYCLGEQEGQGVCVMPYTETTGLLNLTFDDSIMHKISALSSKSSHAFGLVTIGDNNTTDCMHTGLEFDITVRYSKID
jgi:hypothetical protein